MTSLNKYFTLKITKDKRKLQKYRAKDLGEVYSKRKAINVESWEGLHIFFRKPFCF